MSLGVKIQNLESIAMGLRGILKVIESCIFDKKSFDIHIWRSKKRQTDFLGMRII